MHALSDHAGRRPGPYGLAWAFADAIAQPLVDQLKAKPSQRAIGQLQQIMTNSYDNLPAQLG